MPVVIGARYGDVTVQEDARVSDGRFLCACPQGHTMFYKQKTLENHRHLCFVCSPSLLKKNLTDQVLGIITLLKPLGQDEQGRGVMWSALCGCGRELTISQQEIELFSTSGIFSCGCQPADSCPNPHLAGRAFGKLKVLRSNYKQKTGALTSWICRCDCGREVIRSRSGLYDNRDGANCGGRTCRQVTITPRVVTLDADFKTRISAAFQWITQLNHEEKERESAAMTRKKTSTELPSWGELARAGRTVKHQDGEGRFVPSSRLIHSNS